MYKVFIISPHFAPSALPPSQRVRLMVKHTKNLGFETTVFTTESKFREEKNDDWLTQLAGNDFELITLKSLPQKITRKFKIGDLGLRFIPFLFFRLIKECSQQKPDFIIYPVPPWYLLIIAPIIKKITGVKYAIDFIDPWVEVSDFYSSKLKKENNQLTFNYIGAVWPAAFPVVSEVLNAFKTISETNQIQVNFIGTSYAGEGLAKPSLTNFIHHFNLSNIITEDPNRVTYKKAVELTNSADVLFLFGDLSKQYAASKLMGLVASQQPFFAFLHKDSFPYQFLKSVNYKYLVGYSDEIIEHPNQKKDNLVVLIQMLISNLDSFIPISLENEKFKVHTAYGMTKNILNPIKEIIENDKSLR